MNREGTQVKNLTNALSVLIEDTELASVLALVLTSASQTGRASYNEITESVGDNSEEALLAAHKLRLLLPARVGKSGAWEDRPLIIEPGESYVLPNVVGYLVRNAGQTGYWAPQTAVGEVFKEMGEEAWYRMPELVESLRKVSEHYTVTAVQIKKLCGELGLDDRVDMLIAGLKGSGVMSPKLSSLAEVSIAGSPLYELNPSLFVKARGSKL